MSKNLVYTFGPDGAGKSTVVKEIQDYLPNTTSFNASHPETWPDLSWHEEIQREGLDPNTLDPAFHIESIRRCYKAASWLLRTNRATTVIVDSDLQAKAAAKVSAWFVPGTPVVEVYDQLEKVSGEELPRSIRKVGLHVTVGEGSPAERAHVLMGRIASRGASSSFDPATVEQASSLVVAYDELAEALIRREEPLVHVETDHRYDPGLMTRQLTGEYPIL